MDAIRKVLNKIWSYFKPKSKFTWPVSESELERLETATPKFIMPSLDFLNAFTVGGNYEIELEYVNTEKNVLETITTPLSIVYDETKNGIPFRVTLAELLPVSGVKYKESYGLTKHLRIFNKNRELKVSANSITDFKTVFPRRPQILEGCFTNIRSQFNIDSNVFYQRLIIQTKDTDMIYPTSILDFEENYIKYDNQNWDRQSSLMGLSFMSTKGMFVKVKVKEYTFHFYAIEAINSYFIDSTQIISHQEFKDISHKIRVAFGFLSGKYYKDSVMYVMSTKSDFSVIDEFAIEIEEASIVTNNQIINPTLFYTHYKKEGDAIKEVWKKHHKQFSGVVFNSFCEKLLEFPELLRCVEMIISAGGTINPIQKGALNSVCIETLTEFLKTENEVAYKPIKDKALSKEVKEKFISSLEPYSEKIGTKGIEILKKKIGNINEPTNADKFLKSFELYNITLSHNDIQALKHRNDYLHGRKPIESDDFLELEQIALHLHSLVGKLILKYVGYEGHFVNLPSWNLLHNNNLHFEEIDKIDFQEISEISQKTEKKDFSNIDEVEAAQKKLTIFMKLLTNAQLIKDLIQII